MTQLLPLAAMKKVFVPLGTVYPCDFENGDPGAGNGGCMS